MDKLTSRFSAALADAQSLAVGPRPPVHGAGARACARCSTSRTAARGPLLVKAGANVAKLRKDLDAALDRLPKVTGTPGDVHVSQDLNRLLNVTDKLAQQREDEYISSELFVLAVVRRQAHARQTTERRGRVEGRRSKKPSSRCAAVKP